MGWPGQPRGARQRHVRNRGPGAITAAARNPAEAAIAPDQDDSTKSPAGRASLAAIVGPVVLAGAGKMGGAMLSGWLAAGLNPSQTTVVEPQPSAAVTALCASHGVTLLSELPPGPAPSVLVVAVKPQVMATVFPALACRTGPDTLTISI
ncbi:MAG: NAD(P)-binding domain-containing protein, partial [Hyphomicrobiaceae bacterium]|nr:NAD(P)-binding domain-containing protein [Hyphomicrobiaceae bacterium]